ncbi:MAG: hypothetical protein ACT6RL_11295 [Neoaquamicrobium sediminum]|uniref:hypothetical protein n=1 Tax=Neoaquamicrobium sediminum TaxID=1849104 RepID=UPI004037265D
MSEELATSIALAEGSIRLSHNGASYGVQSPAYLGEVPFGPNALNAFNVIHGAATKAAGRLAADTPWKQAQHAYREADHAGAVSAQGRYLRALRDAQRDVETAEAQLLPSVRTLGDARLTTMLMMMAGRKQADLITLGHKDGDAAAVILDNADLFGISEAMLPELRRSFARANLERSFSDRRRPPTMQDPLSERPDLDHAREMADMALKANDARRGDINAGLRWLDSALDFTATLADTAKPLLFQDVAKIATSATQ